MKLTKRPHNHTKFNALENFQVSGSDQTPVMEVTNLNNLIYKVVFTLHPLVELIHNSSNAKEPKNLTSQCLQKRASKLVLSLPRHKKIEIFLRIFFLHIFNTGQATSIEAKLISTFC